MVTISVFEMKDERTFYIVFNAPRLEEGQMWEDVGFLLEEDNPNVDPCGQKLWRKVYFTGSCIHSIRHYAFDTEEEAKLSQVGESWKYQGIDWRMTLIAGVN